MGLTSHASPFLDCLPTGAPHGRRPPPGRGSRRRCPGRAHGRCRARAFAGIAARWQLGVDEQLKLLGSPPRSTYFAWRRHPEKATPPRDTLERLSVLLGIWKSLQILLPDEAAADAWVRKPNAAAFLGGRSALDRMLAGNVGDLHAVRQYLDAVRGGGWS